MEGGDIQRVIWDSVISLNPPEVEFKDVLSSDNAVLEWLEKTVFALYNSRKNTGSAL